MKEVASKAKKTKKKVKKKGKSCSNCSCSKRVNAAAQSIADAFGKKA